MFLFHHSHRHNAICLITLPSEKHVTFYYILLVALNWLFAYQQNNRPTLFFLETNTSPRYFRGLIITVSKWHSSLVPASHPSADVSGMSAHRGGFWTNTGWFFVILSAECAVWIAWCCGILFSQQCSSTLRRSSSFHRACFPQPYCIGL